MGQQKTQQARVEEETVVAVICVMVWLLAIGGFVWFVVSSIASIPPHRAPEFMVSITGVDGLDPVPVPAAAAAATLSPVFNLTVGIANRNTGNVWNSDDACVSGLSTAVVSYGDAFLGRGSVPPFCAREDTVEERAATAWGEGVVLPRFLRERLGAELQRGEAALDVQVIMPTEACARCSDKVLVCTKVKIGGSSPSPCRVEFVRPMHTTAVDRITAGS